MAITTVEPVLTVVCSRCKTAYPLSGFHSDARRKTGHHPWCKACRGKVAIARRLSNPELSKQRGREAMQRWRKDDVNAAKNRAQAAQWKHENPERNREYYMEYNRTLLRKAQMKNHYTLSKFELTVDEYEALYLKLLEDQGGKCGACEEYSTSRLELDHSHQTGTIRALLCGNCNRALGLLMESPIRLHRLATYAEKWSSL